MSKEEKQIPKVKGTEKSIEKSQKAPSGDRRRALKKILVGGGVVSGSLILPNAWVKPAIAQAQTDGAQISPAPTTTGGPTTTTAKPTFGNASVYACNGSFAGCTFRSTITCGNTPYSLGGLTVGRSVRVDLVGFSAGLSIVANTPGDETCDNCASNPQTTGATQELYFTTGTSGEHTITITVGGTCVFTVSWNAVDPG